MFYDLIAWIAFSANLKGKKTATCQYSSTGITLSAKCCGRFAQFAAAYRAE